MDEAEHRTAEQAIQQCMNSNGFEYELAPYFPVDHFNLDRRYGLIDEEQAAAVDQGDDPAEPMNPAFAALDEDGRAAWSLSFFGDSDDIVWVQVGDRRSGRSAGGCHEKGMEAAVGDVDLWVETRELFEQLARDAYVVATADSRVQEAIAQWSSCMRTNGYPTIVTREDLEYIQDDDLLVVDARCNNAVGLATIWFLVESEVQLSLLEERGPMLMEMLAGTSLGD